MKRKLLILLLTVVSCAVCAFGISACTTDSPDNGGGQGTTQTPPEQKPEEKPNDTEKPSVVEVTSVTLNKTTLALEVDGTETLTATVLPSNATDKTVTWQSSDGTVAKVENGKVTALSAGTATITATAGSKIATCTVTITEKVIAVTGVTLNKTSLALEVDGTETLTATVLPGNATDKTVRWQSSDITVAKVENGEVTALKAGTAIITATAGSKSATCTVTVTEKVIAVESVTLNKTSLALKVGDVETLTATVLPSNATDKTVTWRSSDSTVAKVENGKVTALSAGTATITATAGSQSVGCIITVNNKDFSGLVFNSESFTYDGTEKRLVIKNLPEGAEVVYDGNGKINAGTYTVLATVSKRGYNTKTLSATLSIIKATVKNIVFNDGNFVYDGSEKAIAIIASLPEGTGVSYENNNKTNAGTYIVKAIFTVNDNYEPIADMTATLKIEKATVTGISFADGRFVYDGTKKFIAVSGNIPDEMSVEYINNGKISAGEYNVTAIFDCETNNYNIPDDLTANLTIRKATYDMSQIKFENKTAIYDGTQKVLEVTGTLPDGVTVTYKNNSQTNAGQYTVTASFLGDSINYYPIDEMQAMLTINKATYDMSGVTFVGGKFKYDGSPKSIFIAGELPAGVSVEYLGNNKITAGTYTVTASFIVDTSNYNKLNSWSATLIIDKADYDMSGIKFENKTFIYDGVNKSINISGALPYGVSVSYLNNECVNVGKYTVTAKFYGDATNYNFIDDMTAQLIINKAVPYIEEVECAQTLNLYSTVELVAVTEVDGTISFDAGQQLQLGFKNYNWTFVPKDTDNYERVTGQVGLTVCTLVTYFNGNTIFEQQNIVVNNSAYMPQSIPVKDDAQGLRYTFSHWSIEPNGAEFNFTVSITEDFNLYAVYNSEEIIYSIYYYNTFDIDNGNLTEYSVSKEVNLYAISRDYYTFDGWFDSKENQISKIAAGTYGNLRLYAHWTPIEYNIVYASKYNAKNSNPKTYNVESEFNLVAPVFDEYHIFDGWFENEDFTERITRISEGSHKAITLYAKWSFSGTYVSTAAELKSIAYNMRGAYELANNITVQTSDNWVQIGDTVNPFLGYLNGAGYTVKVNVLFGVNGGTIKNINFSGNAFADTNQDSGYIYNCHSTGLLLMQNSGVVDLCSGQAGFVRINNSKGVISNSFATGGYLQYSVDLSDGGQKIYIGGLVPYNDGLIENSFYKGNFSVKNVATFKYGYGQEIYSSYLAGGLVGGGNGTIRQCYCVGEISVSESNRCTIEGNPPRGANVKARFFVSIGVLVGQQKTIDCCYAVGKVSMDVGGLWYPGGDYNIYRTFSINASGFGDCTKSSNSFSEINYGTMSYPKTTNTIVGNTGYRYVYTCYVSYELTGVRGDNCYSSNSTNVTNFMSRDFIIEKLGWGEYIDEEHITDGNVWILENGKYPKLWFEE